jgi:DNA-binding response OmpR family regulator
MRAAGLPSMRDHARLLVQSGIAAADEVARVVGAEEETAPVAPAITRRRVLIVEDDPIARALVRVLLEREGCEAFEARTGAEAVTMARGRELDLIVMDLNMPEMDGFEAIAQIRRLAEHAGTPIVVATAEEGTEIQQTVLTLGADDYLVKPFEPAVFIARVKAAFHRQHVAA